VRTFAVRGVAALTTTWIDVKTNTRVAKIKLGGAVGKTRYDPVSKPIYVNVLGRREMVAIDPARHAIVERIELAGADGNHGLLIEPSLRLAFIAFEGNEKLLVLNLDTKQQIATFELGADPDVLAYDPGPKRFCVADERGVMSIFQISAAGARKIADRLFGLNAQVA
jgi:DNA-binding beta-propeller fold protein YncE